MINHKAGRLCPDCHVGLKTVEYHGVALEECVQCGGFWFDAGELERVRQMGPGAFGEIEQESHMHVTLEPEVHTDRWCPVCPQPLERCRYHGALPVDLDACPKCLGAWIDQEALNRIHQCYEQTRRMYRPAGRSPEEIAQELAYWEQQHDRFMDRQRMIPQVLGMMAHRPWHRRGWWV